MKKIKLFHFPFILLCSLIGLSACIENDIPYLYVPGDILSIEVEGQRGDLEGQNTTASIDKNKRTISLFVSDSVDITELKITKLTISPEAILQMDSSVCVNYKKFPAIGFESLKEIPVSSNTRVNFTKPIKVLLKTYQDYVWTISVKQIIERTIDVEDMTDYLIDEENHQVIIYMPKEYPLNQLSINTMDLGGAYGNIIPDPLEITDLSSPKTFTVYQHGRTDNGVIWTVRAFYKNSSEATSHVFAMANKAMISGTAPSGKSLAIEYKTQKASKWTQIQSSDISIKGTAYNATISKLKPGTNYVYRTTVGDVVNAEQTFSTAAALQLENGSFDNWHQSGKAWNPWASGGSPFWDTGNAGTNIGNTNVSTPVTEGNGKAAQLQSTTVVGVFAAGNIFTGDFLGLEGMNGVLGFGREFNSFPTKFNFKYKYTSKTIDKIGDNEVSFLSGRADSCHIYIALLDGDLQQYKEYKAPVIIRTNPEGRLLFDKNSKNIIAYAEFISGTSTNSYEQKELELEYRSTNRTPKYIVVVASASKYGDYFTGGKGSTLWVDDFNLIYD